MMSSNTSNSVTLSRLLDLAIGTPEKGVVNFNALYTLLRTLLSNLKLTDVCVKFDNSEESESPPSLKSARLIENTTASSLIQLEDKVNWLDNQLSFLRKGPSIQEMLKVMEIDNVVGSTTGKDATTVHQLWRSLQLTKRVTGNEEGIEKLNEYMNDMMLMYNKIQDSIQEMKITICQEKVDDGVSRRMEDLEREFMVISESLFMTQQECASMISWDALEAGLDGDTNKLQKVQSGIISRLPSTSTLLQSTTKIAMPSQKADSNVTLLQTAKEPEKQTEVKQEILKTSTVGPPKRKGLSGKKHDEVENATASKQTEDPTLCTVNQKIDPKDYEVHLPEDTEKTKKDKPKTKRTISFASSDSKANLLGQPNKASESSLPSSPDSNVDQVTQAEKVAAKTSGILMGKVAKKDTIDRDGILATAEGKTSEVKYEPVEKDDIAVAKEETQSDGKAEKLLTSVNIPTDNKYVAKVDNIVGDLVPLINDTSQQKVMQSKITDVDMLNTVADQSINTNVTGVDRDKRTDDKSTDTLTTTGYGTMHAQSTHAQPSISSKQVGTPTGGSRATLALTQSVDQGRRSHSLRSEEVMAKFLADNSSGSSEIDDQYCDTKLQYAHPEDKAAVGPTDSVVAVPNKDVLHTLYEIGQLRGVISELFERITALEEKEIAISSQVDAALLSKVESLTNDVDILKDQQAKILAGIGAEPTTFFRELALIKDDMLLQKDVANLTRNSLHDHIASCQHELDSITEQLKQLSTYKSAPTKQDQAATVDKKKLSHVFTGMENLEGITASLTQDVEKMNVKLESLNAELVRLTNLKADKDFIIEQLAMKADNFDLDKKVDYEAYKSVIDEINTAIDDLIRSLAAEKTEWNKAVDLIKDEMTRKLNRAEMSNLKNWLEARLKALNSKIVKAAVAEDEAAGIRKQLLQKFNCISCDRPVELTPTGPVASIPFQGGLPPTKSPRPYTTFELEQIRLHAKSMLNPSEIGDSYQTDRSCGGSYTVMYPTKRVTRCTTSNLFREDGSCVITPLYKDEAEIMGSDGRIYHGRYNQDKVKLPTLDNQVPRPKSAPDETFGGFLSTANQLYISRSDSQNDMTAMPNVGTV